MKNAPVRSPLAPSSPAVERIGFIENKLVKMEAHDKVLEKKLDAIMDFLKMTAAADRDHKGSVASSATIPLPMKEPGNTSGADARDGSPTDSEPASATTVGSEPQIAAAADPQELPRSPVSSNLRPGSISRRASMQDSDDDYSDEEADFKHVAEDIKHLNVGRPVLLNDSDEGMINPRNQ